MAVIASAPASSITSVARTAIENHATPGDVRTVALNMREQDFTEFMATSPSNDRVGLAHDLALRYGGRDDVFVGKVDGDPVWIGAAIEVWPGVMALMFWGTPDWPRMGLQTTRWIKRELFPRYFAAGIHRIQAISHAEHTNAHAWLRTLGLSEEARFTAFGRAREDFLQFAMVK